MKVGPRVLRGSFLLDKGPSLPKRPNPAPGGDSRGPEGEHGLLSKLGSFFGPRSLRCYLVKIIAGLVKRTSAVTAQG